MTTTARYTRTLRVLAVTAVAVTLSCEREERQFRTVPPTASAIPNVTMTPDLQPGGGAPVTAVMPKYYANAYAMAEGKRLFTQFNCVGCHAHGGGGIGPPLMDAKWIYGAEPQNIFATILEGRPNGMPSFRGKLTNNQTWQLVAYVRSLAGLGRMDARPGRADQMEVAPPENMRDRVEPAR